MELPPSQPPLAAVRRYLVVTMNIWIMSQCCPSVVPGLMVATSARSQHGSVCPPSQQQEILQDSELPAGPAPPHSSRPGSGSFPSSRAE